MKIFKTFFILLLSLFLGWTMLISTPWIKEKALTYVKSEFHAATGWILELEELKIDPLFRITAANVRISNSENHISTEKIHLHISPYEFYRGNILLKDLYIQGVEAELKEEIFFGAAEDLPLISEIPQNITIERFQIKNLKTKIANEPVSNLPQELKGNLKIRPNDKSLQAFIQANVFDEEAEAISLAIALEEKKQEYKGIFTLKNPYAAIKGEVEILSDGSVSFRDLNGAVGPINISGYLALNSSQLIKDSGIQLTIPEFENLGKFTGEAVVTGYLSSPQTSLKIRSPQVTIMQKTLDDLLIDISVGYHEQKLTGQAALTLAKDQNRMEYRSNFHWKRQEAEQSGGFLFTGDLYSILDLFDIDIPLAGGKVALNLALNHSPEGVHFETYVDLSEGYYEILELGTVIQEIEARFSITPNRVNIENLSGNDGRGGTITGNGTCELKAANKFPFKIDLDVNNFSLVQLDYTQAVGSGTLSIFGDRSGAAVTGELRADSAGLTIPQRISEMPETIEITYINIPEGESPPVIPLSSASKWPIEYDLRLIIPGQGQILAEGLYSQWKGEVQFKGKAGKFKSIGEFVLENGTYRFQGKEFRMIQGTITMDGDVRKKTQLYVIGEIEIDDRNIQVILKGPVKNPGISFRSSPPMTQREILSWLIFGQGISNLTPFQGSQLNETITNLKTGKTGEDPLTKFRDAVGLDRIDIKKTESAGADDVTLHVGKYISRGTYLSLTKRNVTDDSRPFIQGTSVGIETKLRNNLKLQAEVGDDANGQLNLLWKKDY